MDISKKEFFMEKKINRYAVKNQKIDYSTSDSFHKNKNATKYEEIDYTQETSNYTEDLQFKINDINEQINELQSEINTLKNEMSNIQDQLKKYKDNNPSTGYKLINEYDQEAILNSQLNQYSNSIHNKLEEIGNLNKDKEQMLRQLNMRKYLNNGKELTEEELKQFSLLNMYAPFLFKPEVMGKDSKNFTGYTSYEDLIDTMKSKGITKEDIDNSLPDGEKINWDLIKSAYSKGITNLDIAISFKLQDEYAASSAFYNDESMSKFISKIEYYNEDELSEAYEIYKNQGLEAFKNYLDNKQAEINQREGLINALNFLSTIDLEDPKYQDYIKTHFKGLEDGLEQFGHGMEVFLSPIDSLSKNVTSDQYEAMFIATILAQSNSNVDLGVLGEFNALEKVYTLSMAEGNMLPSMLAGTLGSVFGLEGLGAFTMFCSVTGTSAENAYQQGYDIYSSWFYGALSGASEAGLEFLLGGIPGISKIADKSFLTKIFSEGIEESLQEILDPYLKYLTTGEKPEIDWSKVAEAGIDGMILAAYLNGGEVVIGTTTIGKETLDFLQNNYQHFKNNNTSIKEITEILDNLTSESFNTVKELQEKGIEVDFSRITEDGYIEGLKKSTLQVEFNEVDISRTVDDESLKSNDDYVEETALFGNKENFISKIFGRVKFSSTNIELSVQERILSNQINDYISQYGSVSVTFNNTAEFSTGLLRSIKDLSALKVRINGGFNDINGNFRSKYNNAKYVDRITYTGYEALAISEKLDELTSMVDMNLPTTERAKQIYEILSSEVPVMHDFNYYPDGHRVSASLRGLTDINNVGKAGLVCAGYSQAYKELCTRCGIQCDYIRGIAYGDVLRQGRPGGHAWNIVIDGSHIIPVDVTWKACGSGEWFGGSDAFVARHIADSDEMFRDYSAPKTAFELISEALDNHDLKYGTGTGIRQLELYLQDRNIDRITSFGGARETIRNMSLDQLNEYLKTQRANQDIEYVMHVMTQKYGLKIAWDRMKAYINPSSEKYGKLSEFTRTGNCRGIMQHIDLSYIQQYIGVGDKNGTNK